MRRWKELTQSFATPYQRACETTQWRVVSVLKRELESAGIHARPLISHLGVYALTLLYASKRMQLLLDVVLTDRYMAPPYLL